MDIDADFDFEQDIGEQPSGVLLEGLQAGQLQQDGDGAEDGRQFYEHEPEPSPERGWGDDPYGQQGGPSMHEDQPRQDLFTHDELQQHHSEQGQAGYQAHDDPAADTYQQHTNTSDVHMHDASQMPHGHPTPQDHALPQQQHQAQHQAEQHEHPHAQHNNIIHQQQHDQAQGQAQLKLQQHARHYQQQPQQQSEQWQQHTQPFMQQQAPQPLQQHAPNPMPLAAPARPPPPPLPSAPLQQQQQQQQALPPLGPPLVPHPPAGQGGSSGGGEVAPPADVEGPAAGGARGAAGGDGEPPEQAVSLSPEAEAALKEALDSGCKVCIAGMTWWTCDADLETLCQDYGKVVNIEFVADRSNGKSKGIATVEFTTPEAAVLARENLHGHTVHGRSLVVTYQKAGPAAKPGPPFSVHTATSVEASRQSQFATGGGGYGGRGAGMGNVGYGNRGFQGRGMQQQQHQGRGYSGNRGFVNPMGAMDMTMMANMVNMSQGMLAGMVPGMMAPGMMMPAAMAMMRQGM